MGNTLAGSRLVLEEGTIDALEGVFEDGCAWGVCELGGGSRSQCVAAV